MAAPEAPGDQAREAAVEAALAGLDLDAKARLLAGQDMWTLPALPEIGLESLVMSDGPIGVRGVRWTAGDPSVALPSPTALAATWDPALARPPPPAPPPPPPPGAPAARASTCSSPRRSPCTAPRSAAATSRPTA